MPKLRRSRWLAILLLSAASGFLTEGCIPPHPPYPYWAHYEINLRESHVADYFQDPGGPDQYIVVKHKGSTILRTGTQYDTYHAFWWGESTDFWFRSGDVLRVYLMDEDRREDDIIASWRVHDAYQLRRLTQRGNRVRFTVREIWRGKTRPAG